ncbi:MAG: hypothetical protein KDB03_00565 [Planctomycetales bacterium]|nr:hypothetical protein [Planctomycetales bacterium]
MADNETPEIKEKATSSLMPKLIVGVFIAIVVIAEIVIFFVMVPSADDVAALAEARLIGKVEASMTKDNEELVEEDPNSLEEFPLEEYGLSFVPPGQDRSYRVEFRLFGVVRKKDLERIEKLYGERKNRFRDRMLTEIRNATRDELYENQLGLIKRRILAISNEVLEVDGEPILVGIGFPDYQVFEE